MVQPEKRIRSEFQHSFVADVMVNYCQRTDGFYKPFHHIRRITDVQSVNIFAFNFFGRRGLMINRNINRLASEFFPGGPGRAESVRTFGVIQHRYFFDCFFGRFH